MKTLFISDLDGTLLTPAASLSPHTIEILNRCMAQGMNFSIATARTRATVEDLLSPLQITIPVVMQNGVLRYDLQAKRYLDYQAMPPESARRLLETMKALKLTGFLYTMEEGRTKTYYENLDTHQRKVFYGDRVQKYGKVFYHSQNFLSLQEKEILYLSLNDREELLRPFARELETIPGLKFEFYQDIYSDCLWFLEIFSETASKENGVAAMRREYGFERIVAFGDNFNDLGMFRAADVAIAVENARPEIRQQADRVIGANREDGVARWLETHWRRWDALSD